jgi:acetolactate synthase-1/2/3 large subunit
LNPSTTTIASHAVAVVTGLGCDTVFTLTGGMAMHLNRAVSAQAGLEAVYCQHEQAAVAAAEGYAHASDFRRPGFAVVTSGPGVTNTVTALMSAFGDSAPVIVLAGQIKRADINPFGVRTYGTQEAPSEAIITPCVKRFTRIDIEGFRDALVSTLADALSGRPGPVFIEFPLDVQGTPVSLGPEDVAQDVRRIRETLAAAGEGSGDAAALEAQLVQLLQAERPLLYVGNGCRVAGVEDVVRDLIDRHRLPAVFSWLSFDIVAADHPLHFGCPGGFAPISANRILGRADRILFLGARLDLGTTAFQREAFGDQAHRCFVDVDQAELRKFDGLADSQVLHADLRHLPRATDGLTGAVDPAWTSWCAEQRSTGLEEERRRLSTPALNNYTLAQRFSAWAQEKVLVPACSGFAEETLTRFFAPPKGCRFFNGASLGAMGFGLPMALGAAFATPRQVVCIDADGGLMLNVQELATLSRIKRGGFILFVLNNGGYDSIRLSQVRHFGETYGTDAANGVFIPDFAELARAFQIAYRRIATLAEFDAFLAEHDPASPPIFVDLIIAPDEPRGPAVKTVISADGMPVTTALRDIDW